MESREFVRTALNTIIHLGELGSWNKDAVTNRVFVFTPHDEDLSAFRGVVTSLSVSMSSKQVFLGVAPCVVSCDGIIRTVCYLVFEEEKNARDVYQWSCVLSDGSQISGNLATYHG